MKPFRDYSIRIKVLIPPLILALGMSLMGIFTKSVLSQLTTTIDTISTEITERVSLIDEIVILTEQVQSNVFYLSVLTNMGVSDEIILPVRSRLERQLNDLNVVYGEIKEKWDLDAQEKDLLDQIQSPLQEFRKQTTQAADIVVQNPAFGVVMVRSSSQPFEELQSLLAEFREYEETLVVQAGENARRNADRINTTDTFAALILTFAVILATILISDLQITQPVQKLTQEMTRLAGGELEREIEDASRKDEMGEMARALAFFRQTMIKKELAESDLAESQRAMASLLDSLPGFAYRCKNDLDWTMTFLSDGCLELTGYAPDELISNSIISYGRIINPDDRDMVWETIQASLAKKENFQLEYRIMSASGDEKWVWEQGSGIVDEAGQVKFLEGYITEVTDRVEAQTAQLEAYEQALARQSAILNLTEDLRHEISERKVAERKQEQLFKELELKNQEMESFVYTISHDLKAPLISLDGFSAALMNENHLSDRGEHYLERIRANTAQMSTLITELLELSRIGRVVGERLEVDVTALLEDVYLDFDLDLPGSILRVQEPLPSTFADRVRLRQVFANLIGNAIKFKSQERPLKIQIGGSREEGFQRYWVKDNGIGIPEKHIDRIFEPFQQLNPAAAGVGMGLTLVKKIIEHHGGRVWVESQFGEGSTFWFTIPYKLDKDND